MPNFGAQTWPHRFLPDMRDRVVSQVPELTADRVFRSNYPDDDHVKFPPADKFVTLFMPDFPVDQPAVSGGGAYNTPADGSLDATVFVRLEADIEHRSTQAMEDDANGVDQFVLKVLTALHMYPGLLDDASGLYVLRRPMRARRVTVVRKPGAGDARWNVAKINFEVSFVADLGFPYPT